MEEDELSKEIERAKQNLRDYQRLAPLIKVSKEDYNRQIDMMLDDLLALLKKKKD